MDTDLIIGGEQLNSLAELLNSDNMSDIKFGRAILVANKKDIIREKLIDKLSLEWKQMKNDSEDHPTFLRSVLINDSRGGYYKSTYYFLKW